MKRLVLIIFLVSGISRADGAFTQAYRWVMDNDGSLKSFDHSVLFSKALQYFDYENEDFDFDTGIEIEGDQSTVLDSSDFIYIKSHIPLPLHRVLLPGLLDLPPPSVS